MDPASLSLPGGIVYHYLLNYQLRIRAGPTTMDIYGHLMPGAKRDAARKMDHFFGNSGNA